MQLPSFLRFGDRSPAQIPKKPAEPQLVKEEEAEDINTYIEIFVENGLKLHNEIMVNHEAIAAAKDEYVEEFHRRRQIA